MLTHSNLLSVHTLLTVAHIIITLASCSCSHFCYSCFTPRIRVTAVYLRDQSGGKKVWIEKYCQWKDWGKETQSQRKEDKCFANVYVSVQCICQCCCSYMSYTSRVYKCLLFGGLLQKVGKCKTFTGNLCSKALWFIVTSWAEYWLDCRLMTHSTSL